MIQAADFDGQTIVSHFKNAFGSAAPFEQAVVVVALAVIAVVVAGWVRVQGRPQADRKVTSDDLNVGPDVVTSGLLLASVKFFTIKGPLNSNVASATAFKEALNR